MAKRCLSRWFYPSDLFVRCVIDLPLLVDVVFLHPELLGEDALLHFAPRGVVVAHDLLFDDAAGLDHLPGAAVILDPLFDDVVVHLLLEDVAVQDHLSDVAVAPDRPSDVVVAPDRLLDDAVTPDLLLNDAVAQDHLLNAVVIQGPLSTDAAARVPLINDPNPQIDVVQNQTPSPHIDEDVPPPKHLSLTISYITRFSNLLLSLCLHLIRKQYCTIKTDSEIKSENESLLLGDATFGYNTSDYKVTSSAKHDSDR